MPFEIVPTGGATDQINGSLMLIPFARTVKDKAWLADREANVGERENEIKPCPKGLCVGEPCVSVLGV